MKFPESNFGLAWQSINAGKGKAIIL